MELNEQKEEDQLVFIKELIERETEFNVLNIKWNQKGYYNLINVEDRVTEEEYSLVVYNLNDGRGNVCQKKLSQAQQRVQILQKCQHENIMKYFSDFKLKYYFFIQLEKYSNTLDFWKAQYKNFSYFQVLVSKIAYQIANVMTYLHKQNYYIKNLSQKHIIVNGFHNIKIWNFSNKPNNLKTVFDENSSPLLDQQINYCAFTDILEFGKLIKWILEGQNYENGQSKAHIHQLQSQNHIKLGELLQPTNPKIRNYNAENLKNVYQKLFHVQLSNIEEIIFFECAKQQLMKDIKKEDSTPFNKDFFLLCLDKSPQNPKVLYYTGLAFKNALMQEEAIRCFNKAIEVQSTLETKCANQLEELTKEMNIQKKKIQLLKNQLKQDPNNIKILDELIINCSLAEQDQHSLSLYYQFKEENPNKILKRSETTIAYMYQERGMVQEAIQILKNKLNIEKYNFDCLQGLGNIYIQQVQYHDAIQCFKQILSQNQKIFTQNFFYKRITTLYELLHDYSSSIKYLKKLVRLNPQDFNHLENLGQQYHLNKQFIEAILCYEKCERLQKSKQLIITYLGNRYIEAGLYDKAKQRFLKQIIDNPEDDIFYSKLGIIYLEKGDFQKAQYSFKRSIELNSSSEQNFLSLSNIYYQRQHYFHAIQSFLQYCSKRYQVKKRNLLKINHSIILKKLKKTYSIQDSEISDIRYKFKKQTNTYIYLKQNRQQNNNLIQSLHLQELDISNAFQNQQNLIDINVQQFDDESIENTDNHYEEEQVYSEQLNQLEDSNEQQIEFNEQQQNEEQDINGQQSTQNSQEQISIGQEQNIQLNYLQDLQQIQQDQQVYDEGYIQEQEQEDVKISEVQYEQFKQMNYNSSEEAINQNSQEEEKTNQQLEGGQLEKFEDLELELQLQFNEELTQTNFKNFYSDQGESDEESQFEYVTNSEFQEQEEEVIQGQIEDDEDEDEDDEDEEFFADDEGINIINDLGSDFGDEQINEYTSDDQIQNFNQNQQQINLIQENNTSANQEYIDEAQDLTLDLDEEIDDDTDDEAKLNIKVFRLYF